MSEVMYVVESEGVDPFIASTFRHALNGLVDQYGGELDCYFDVGDCTHVQWNTNTEQTLLFIVIKCEVYR